MRRGASSLILFVALCGATAAFADVACIPPTSQELLNGSTFAAIATAPRDWELDVQLVLSGASTLKHFDTRVDRLYSCGLPQEGHTYLISLSCGFPHSENCGISMRELDEASDDLAFLHARHYVTRVEMIDELRRWHEGKESTRALRRWMKTADTPASYGCRSITASLLNHLGIIAEELEELESIAPQKVVAVRGQVPILLRVLRDLPIEETEGDFRSGKTLLDAFRLMNDELNAFYETPEWRAANKVLSDRYDSRPKGQ